MNEIRDCKTVKCYNQTNHFSEYCYDCYNRKREDAQWQACTQCGGDTDLLAQFTSSGVCGKCARRNHKNI